MKLNIKELTFIGLIALLMFLLSFLIGNTLTFLIPIPAASGITNVFIHGIILTIALLVIRKFWTATIIWTIYGILSIPTNLMAGVPGLYKVGVAIICGLILDSVIYIFKYKIKGIYISITSMAIVETALLILLYIKLEVPGSSFIINNWLLVLVLFAGLMCFGGFFGIKIYNKIKNKKAIKLIQGK
jgi:hypothetical protein